MTQGLSVNVKRTVESEAGSRNIGGMTSRQTHQAVMDRIRQRFSGYRKHHSECQNKYAHSLPVLQDLERQEAINLHKRAIDSRNRSMNVNGKAAKQPDGEGKVEPQQQQLANGFDKSTNAILHIREQILLKKRKHEQNMSSGMNSFSPSTDDNSTLGGECVNKFQRQDGLLQASEVASSVATTNQVRQVGHATAQLHQTPFGSRENSYIQDGCISTPRISTTISSETFVTDAQGLSSSPFVPPDFKQEKNVIVSCNESSHSSKAPGTLVNGLNQVSGLCTGEEYIQQQLRYFDHVIQARFNEDGASTQTIQHPANAAIQACDDDRACVPETSLVSHHPKSHQLKEFARKSQLAQQVVPYIDNQDQSNHQFSHRSATPYALGSAGHPSSGLQHSYSTSKYHGGGIPMISNDQQQMLPESNHPISSVAGGFPRQFESSHHQRGQTSQPHQQQHQHHHQQQSFYRFSQSSLPSSKLSHMPSQSQQLYSQRFRSQQVLPTSQGKGLVRPTSSHNLTRYSMPRSQTVYQRQTSMPPLQGQVFLNSDSQYQQQVAGFQGDQTCSNSTAELAATYHYQRRNSFPMYHNNSQQPENLSFRMQQSVGSSQAGLLRGVLQNPSQSILSDRDYVVNPTMRMSSPTTLQTGPLLTGRPPSANADLNPAVPKSQHSSIMYRSTASQQSASLLQQGGKFQATHNARKVSDENSYQVLNPTSVVHKDISETQTSVSSGPSDAQFNAYSPLNALDKAPSFTSLLEQSAINPGNLETTYTGSIPNLDLLGEILGQ